MRYLALLLVARTAAADDGGYATLAHQDREAKLGAAVTYFNLPSTGQWTRLDVAGQIVHPATGLGAYAQMPFAYEATTNGNQIFALGGLELGGLLATRSGAVLHVGVVLPTASSGDNATVITPTVAARPGDRIQTLPNSTSLRAALAYELRAAQVFGRVELGFDLPLLVDDATSPASSTAYLHIDAAIGFDADDLTLTLETTNAFALGSESTTFDAIAAAIRFRAGTTRPYLAAVVPLDAQQSEPKVAFIAGIELRFCH